jgi:hypothetical protein
VKITLKYDKFCAEKDKICTSELQNDKHENLYTMKKHYHFYRASIVGLFLMMGLYGYAQPPGWQYEMPITIYENSGSMLTDHQVPLTINTQALIAANQMLSDGSDIRFGTGCTGGPLEYWIEDYMNTDSTRIWVKVDTIPANDSVTIMMFHGNQTAVDMSTISIFEGPFSGNDSLTGGNPGGSGDRQRGYFFRSTRDILVTQFGKYEPTGTTRYLTLFDSISQALLEQIQVPGSTAAALSYAPIPKPMWLNSGQTYLISIFLQTGDQYYISSGNTQMGPYLRYGRTGWCNTCTQNTFPTNATTGHFGYPDIEYYVRDSAGVYPTYQIKPIVDVDAGTDVELCMGDAAQMMATGSGGAGTYTYQWSPSTGLNDPNIGNPVSTVTSNTGYIVMVTDDIGCTSTDTVMVNVNANPSVDLGPDGEGCAGDVLTLDATTAGTTYLWSDNSTNATLPVSTTGSYWVEVTDGNTCTDRDTIDITIHPLPAVDLGADTMICFNHSITLDAGTFSSYLWSNSTTNQTLVVDGSVTGAGTFMYTVEVTDANSCTNIDTVTVIVDLCTGIEEGSDEAAYSIYPNPNDGLFTLNITNPESGTITVLNLIGEQIFAATLIGNSTETIDLREQPKGVYLVQIETATQVITKKVVVE